MNVTSFFKRLILKNKLRLILYFISNVIILLINIFIISLVGSYVDILINEKKLKNIYNFSFKVIILTLVLMIITYIVNIMKTKLITKVSYNIHFGLIKKLKVIDLSYISNNNPNYLSQKIYNDSSTIASFFINNIVNLFIEVIAVLLILILILNININMGIIMIMCIPIYILVYNKFKKPLYNKGYYVKEEQNKFFSIISTQLQNLKYIKLNSFYKETNDEIENEFNVLYDKILKHTKVSSIFSMFGSIFNNIFQVILIFFGGLKVIEGSITVGGFTIINTYFSSFIKSINYFLQFGQYYQDFLISFNRINDIENLNDEKNGQIYLEYIDKITVKDLSFGYDINLFNNYSYEFQKGNIYYIKGRNGVGKSSFINIIMGVYGNYEGNIYYNDINIKNLDLYKIRKYKIGLCEQYPYLLNKTILENLTYGISEYNTEMVIDYVNKLDLNIMIDRYSKGIDSVINYKNDNVSGGEKQKISLCRLLVKNSDLMILDEPSSSLDSKSIENLKNILLNLKKDKIIIIISHDDDMLDIASNIIEFEAEERFILK